MSEQMWWSRDADGIAHLDDGILLACIRQQSLGKNEPDIRQHIAHCEKCQKRCNELEQPSAILNDTLLHSRPLLKEDAAWGWLESSTAAQFAYQRRQQERLHEDLALGVALLTRLPQVLVVLLAQAIRTLLPYTRKFKPEPRRREHRGMGIIPLSGGFAAVSLILVLTAIVVFAALNGDNPFKPSHLRGGIVTVVASLTIVVPVNPTPTPAVVQQSGVTLTPSGPIPIIFGCMTNNDKTTHRFRICGKNFKPSIKIELVLQFGDGSSKTRHPMWVDASGKFQDDWPISACKDVPITILAQNMTHPPANLVVLQNIQYEKCSSRQG